MNKLGRASVTEGITCNQPCHTSVVTNRGLLLAHMLRMGAPMKFIILGLSLVIASACGRETTPTPPNTEIAETPSLPSGYSRVEDTSQVCMVTNQYMGSAQIPVAVENRTYYGCCPMCKDRLNNEPAIRTARDPVTGENVDKATAVIVKAADGKLLYFASERTLGQFRG